MPNRTKSPESGQFVGDVVALLFPPRPPELAGKPRDPLTEVPGLVARTSAIRFDTQLLEFASDDAVTIETPDVRFQGTGVLVRGNQVLDRIEYLKVAEDGLIRYRFASKQPSDAAPSAPIETEEVVVVPPQTGWEIITLPDFSRLVAIELDESASDADADVTEPAVATAADHQMPDNEVAQPTEEVATGEPTTSSVPVHPAAAVAAARARQQQLPIVKEDLYEAVFADTVRVTQQKRRLAADTLFVWLRTFDNKLPDGAFGQLAASAPVPARRSRARLPAAGRSQS